MRKRSIPLVALLLVACLSPVWAQEGGDEKRNPQEVERKAIQLLQEKKYDEAIVEFKKLVDWYPQYPNSYYNIACAYSLKGEKEKAVEWLRKSVEKGFDDLNHINQDTDLDNIRETDGFKKLIKEFFSPKALPDFQCLDIEEKPFKLSELRGKVVLIDFWATWCGWCRKGIPHLIELQKKYGDRGLVVLGLSDEPAKTQAPFAKKMGITYRLLITPPELPKPFSDVQGYPTAFLIDREGMLIKKVVGYQQPGVFDELVRPALGAEPEPKPEPKPEAKPEPKPEAKPKPEKKKPEYF